MKNLLGGDFVFAAMTPTPPDRLKLGYHDMNSEYDFVLRTYDGEEQLHKAHELNLNSDVVISGNMPSEMLLARADKNLLTFKFSERLYKTGIRHMFSPSGIREIIREEAHLRHKNVFLLCAGAYVASDYAFLGNYLGKAYKWGYFPQCFEEDVDELIAQKTRDKLSLLWAGRLLDWKHPEAAVEAARRLAGDGYDFKLDIIGIGEEESHLVEMIDSQGLAERVHLLGALSPEEVRGHMRRSDIFLFTSDRNEGWGAVLNEAMNSGCAVVCDRMIGAAPYLIRHGYNGFMYNGRRLDNMYKYVRILADDQTLRKKIAKRAYETIINEWNGINAAGRLVKLSETLLAGKDTPFQQGVCSREHLIHRR